MSNKIIKKYLKFYYLLIITKYSDLLLKIMRRQTEDLDQEKEGNILSWLTINNSKMKTLE